jgi:hypothetical protein
MEGKNKFEAWNMGIAAWILQENLKQAKLL